MLVIGIDPGTKESGYISWDGKNIIAKGIADNASLLNDIRARAIEGIIVIEGIQYFGKPSGSDVFKTCYFIGRIMEAAGIPIEKQEQHLVYRKNIKLFLCGTVRAKDKDIRQALIDRLGKEITKGVFSHVWSALALAIVAWEIRSEKIHLKEREVS